MNTVQQYKCPSCGAPLVFSGEKQMLHCQSCGSDFSVETMQQIDEAEANTSKESKFNWDDYQPRSFKNDSEVDLSNYICSSCGAQVIGEPVDGAMTCLYCGNTIIIKEQFDGGLEPDFIIPFKIEKDSAMKLLKESCKSKKLLPKNFLDDSKLKEIKGIYIPFWTADCECDADITYNAKKVSSWRSGNYRYTQTEYYNLYRSGDIAFERIPVDASKNAEDSYMDAIEPYDYNEAVEFNSAYLSGYLADRYDVDFDECVNRINKRIKKTTEEKFADTTGGYTSVTASHSAINCEHGKLRYALMPVWSLNVKYNDEMYKYVINGQTGKLVGKYPISAARTIGYFFKIFAIAGVIFGGVSALLMKGGLI